MKLLILGKPNSFFTINYVSWLKKTMDVEVDIFPVDPIEDKEKLPYDYIYENKYYQSIWSKIPFLRRYLMPVVVNYNLFEALNKRNIDYDFIHIQWVKNYWLLNCTKYKKYCTKLFVTFWGREYATGKLFESQTFFRKKIKDLLSEADLILQTSEKSLNALRVLDPNNASKVKTGYYFGSEAIDVLQNVRNQCSIQQCKLDIGLNPNKFVIAIGYSGKKIHQHIDVITALTNNRIITEQKEKIQIVFPMTYDYQDKYIHEVKKHAKNSGFEFVIIEGNQSAEFIAKMRNATDVFLQLSTTDGVSRSVLEYLCVGTHLIVGDWIDYEYFIKEGFDFAYVDSINNGVEELAKYLTNNILDRNAQNVTIGIGKYSWKDAIIKWADCYKTHSTC